MKKIILLSFFIFLCGIAFAQDTLYRLPNKYVGIRFDGTHECYDSIFTTFNLPYDASAYLDNTQCIVNGYLVNTGDIYCIDPITTQFIIPSAEIQFYTNNQNILYPAVYSIIQTDSISDLMMPRSEAEAAIADMQLDINAAATPSWTSITGKPSFFDGDYNSLLNKPTIPTNTNQLTNGSGFLTTEVDGSVTNEIELPSQTGQTGKVLTTNGSNVSWTTPAAYTAGTGISITSNIITNTSPDQTVVLTGSNGITTSGTYPNFTIAKTKRQETYTGTTAATVGTYTVTYGTSYSAAPNLQVAIQSDCPSCTAVISAKSTTGFTVKVYQLSSILSLGLVPVYSPVGGIVVDVIVTEK